MTGVRDIESRLRERYGEGASGIEVVEVTPSASVILRCTGEQWCDAPREIARLLLDSFGDIRLVIDLGGLAFSRNTLRRADDGR